MFPTISWVSFFRWTALKNHDELPRFVSSLGRPKSTGKLFMSELQLQICPEQNIIISPYPINNRDKNEGLRSSWTNVDPATMLRSLLLTVQRFNDIPQYHKLLKIKTFIALKYSYLYFWYDMECIDWENIEQRRIFVPCIIFKACWKFCVDLKRVHSPVIHQSTDARVFKI